MRADDEDDLLRELREEAEDTADRLDRERRHDDPSVNAEFSGKEAHE